MLGKRRRHELIRTVVVAAKGGNPARSWCASSQGMGCDVTQATVSRDVRELGLLKRRDSGGRPRYVLPEADERRDPEAACSRMLTEFATAVITAQNLVLVKSEVGTAPGHGPRHRRPGTRADPGLRRRGRHGARRHRRHRGRTGRGRRIWNS